MRERRPPGWIGSTSPSRIKNSARASFPRSPELLRDFRVRVVGIVSVLVLPAGACGGSSTSPRQSEMSMLTGEISIEHAFRLSHIPSSRVAVQLEDASLQDASSVVIAEEVYEGVTALPLTYGLTSTGELDPGADHSVAASVHDESGEPIFWADTLFPVYPGDADADFRIVSVCVNWWQGRFQRAQGRGSGRHDVSRSSAMPGICRSSFSGISIISRFWHRLSPPARTLLCQGLHHDLLRR